MNKTVLLTVNYKGRPLEIVRGLVPDGFDLITMETTGHDEFVDKAREVDYILASGNLKIDSEVIDSAKNLRMIQRLGVGLDSLDLPYLREKNIPVYVNKGVNADSVAEHAVMFILASLRHLTLISANTKNGIWKKQEQGVTTRELSTQTVGLLGSGNIGRKVAALLKPFGCRVIYNDIYRLPKEQETELGIIYRSQDDLFKEADIITLHCPLVDDTRLIINDTNLGKMKDGVILVNTSRGGLVDEEALLRALESGKVSFAALDVYQKEPLIQNALIEHEHVMCTPHIAGNTYDSFYKMMSLAFNSIKLYDQGSFKEIEEFKIK